VAFPLISAGIYRWPAEDAIAQALTALRAAATRVGTARLVLFELDRYELARTLLG
jgi:O-acetyl-ADP-ribose deacetylase (regulator of RNase III)